VDRNIELRFSLKTLGIAALAVFIFGVGMDQAVTSPPAPEKIKVAGPTKTVTVHDTPPTVYVQTPVSEHCKLAIKEAGAIARQANKLYANGDRQLAISSNYRALMADGKNTTPAEDQQRTLLGHEVGDLRGISDSLSSLQTEIKLCKVDQAE
jgi:hypothetical protein